MSNSNIDILYLDKKNPPRLKERTVRSERGVLLDGTKEFKAYDSETHRFICHYVPDYVDKMLGEFFITLKYEESHRLSGLTSQSQIFGYAPRDYLKNLPARRTKFDRNNPKAAVLLEKLARQITETMETANPEVYDRQKNKFEEIVNEIWRLRGTVFSGGIINLDTQYLYHTDNGNVEDCISGMLTFKKNVDGGELHLPEYDVTINTQSGSLLLFDGATVSHGVLPFTKKKASSHRITIVFYALEKFKDSEKDYRSELNAFNVKQLQKHEKGYYAKK